MKALIIYAHPQTQGHNPFILKQVTKKLEEKNIEFNLIDLYKVEYDPILHENEHYTSGKRGISKENLNYQKMIKEADLQIYVYPMWWGSMPAILKGFFDKNFTSHFAFKYVNGLPVGLLKGKKAIVFMTCGAPSLFYKILFRGPIWQIKKGILGFCGIKAKVHLLGKSTKLTDKRKEKVKKMVKKAI